MIFVQSGVGAVGSGLGAVGGGLGLGHDLSADALKAREAAVQAREDACKARCYQVFPFKRCLF
jgi:hypothetical protein